MRYIIAISLLLNVFFTGAQKKDEVSIVFHLNPSDEVKLESLRFYVGVINDETFDINYFLIDPLAGDSIINFLVPRGKENIELLFGTDSLSNICGAFEGALDPIHGMYWTWNTGFINLKIEGKYKKEHIEWHLGGYKAPYDTQIKRTFPLLGKKELVLSIHLEQLVIQHLDDELRVMRPGEVAKSIFESFVNHIYVD